MDRILIVEDESIIALNMQHTLQRLGYEVVGTAGTSAEAVSLAESARPDLVLMDINLGPGDDGIETAAQLSRQRRAAVIYLTSYSEDATLKRARETGPYGYLVKPFSERELHATIQMAIQRRRADLALAAGEQHLHLALQAAEMGSWEVDLESDRVQRETFTDTLFGIDTLTFDGSWKGLLERVAAEDRGAVATAKTQAHCEGGSMSIDCRATRVDGKAQWLRLQARHHARDGLPARLIGVACDVTAARRDESSLREAAAVFGSSGEAIFIADGQLRVVAVNDAFSVTTGHARAEVVGRQIDEWLFPDLDDFGAVDLAAALAVHGSWQGEMTAMRCDGETFPAWMNAIRAPGEPGEEPRTICVFSDIGALHRADKQLVHLAHHDFLTGLPNRLLAMDRLDQAIARARRNQSRIAVMMIDLDHFKHVNDTLGHSAGDEMLRVVASRLKSSLRDIDTVARLGGDEFLVILEEIELDSDVIAVAAKLLRHLGEPLMLAGCEVRSCASLGIGMFPSHAEDRDSLVRAADVAMYTAKKAGRNRLAFSASKSMPFCDFVGTR